MGQRQVELDAHSPNRTGEEQTEAIQEFRADFTELLAEIESLDSLVVFIDDLDRCLPATIIETFEAIRLFLAVPKTAFVIAADERIIRYAVRSRYPAEVGGTVDLGRDYLEKIVQVPVRIPPLTAAEVETFLNLLFVQADVSREGYEALRARAAKGRVEDALAVSCNYGIAAEVLQSVPEELQQRFELVARIAPILANGLSGNPRQLKRFMNALALRQSAAGSRGVDLDAAVLVKLMILEYLHESQFKRLFEWQAASDGRPPELADLERAVAEGKEPTTPDAVTFASDPALPSWVALDPPLAEVDLQPYFYFSRDRIEITAPGRRLPPDLQELLAGLGAESETYRSEALEKAVDLSETELRALIEALSDRFARVPATPHLASSLIDIASARSEMTPLVVAAFAAVPPVSVDASVPLKLGTKAQGAEVDQLLSMWADQKEASQLARAAKTAIDRMQKGGS